jgi:hypothetical protein
MGNLNGKRLFERQKKWMGNNINVRKIFCVERGLTFLKMEFSNGYPL